VAITPHRLPRTRLDGVPMPATAAPAPGSGRPEAWLHLQQHEPLRRIFLVGKMVLW